MDHTTGTQEAPRGVESVLDRGWHLASGHHLDDRMASGLRRFEQIEVGRHVQDPLCLCHMHTLDKFSLQCDDTLTGFGGIFEGLDHLFRMVHVTLRDSKNIIGGLNLLGVDQCLPVKSKIAPLLAMVHEFLVIVQMNMHA